MNLLETENELIETYSFIEDRHERLNAIISRQIIGLELEFAERLDEFLVKGCSSQVWLNVEVVDKKLKARFAADSVMVKGLVSLLVQLYNNSTLTDAQNFSPRLLEVLELDRMLSPTRLHGLAQVIRTFKEASHVD